MSNRAIVAASAVCLLGPALAGAAPGQEAKGRPVITQTAASDHPPGLALGNVPPVGFFDPTKSTTGAEECPLPALLRVCLQTGGGEEPPGGDWHRVYVTLMGASGAAFRLVWDPQARESYAMLDLGAFAEDRSEPVRRALESVGWSYERVLRGEVARATGYPGPTSDDEGLYRARLIESIRRGRPAILFGAKPPASLSLVTGYDADGAVLLTRPFLHRETASEVGLRLDALGNSRSEEWFKETLGILTLGEPVEPLPEREAHRRALQWALQVMRAPRVRGLASGFAAHDAWADSLLRPPAFAEDAPETGECYRTHRVTTFQWCEARVWAAEFLRQVAAAEPAVKEELAAAATCFEAAHDAAWEIGAATSFHWLGEELKRFCTPWRRQYMAERIRRAKAQEQQAAGHMENALAKLRD